MELQQTNNQVLHQKTWFHRFRSRSVRVLPILVGAALSVTYANAAVDLGIDGDELKSIILGLIATIALIGTAYLTVLVSVSAFSVIRRVIKG